MNDHDNILCGFDGSDESKAAAREAMRIAAASGGRLLILEVVHDELIAEIESETGVPGDDVVAARGLRLRHEIEGLCHGEPIPGWVEVKVVKGHPFAALMSACQQQEIDLLVLGATGTTGLRHSSLGAVARSAVRHAPCETMLVRGGETDGFRTVVCGIDFSSTSVRALARAAAIARADGARFALVAIYTPDWLEYLHEYGGGVEVPEDVAERYGEELATRLSAFVAEHIGDIDGVDMDVVALQAVNPPVGICDYARKIEADLVVIGTVGRARDDVRPLGSTAEYVIHSAGCSVLAVRPGEDEDVKEEGGPGSA